MDVELPYSGDCPVIYDNDDHRDVYTDEFLLALASAGKIDLRGMVTSYSYDQKEYEEFVEGREEIVERARRSGMKNLPDPVAGPNVSLVEPSSSNIEDTEPIDTEGSRLIIEEADDTSPEDPLVIVTGGPLTNVADAYLLEPDLTESVVVSSLLGTQKDTSGWNGELDSWATYIVTTKFRYVHFPTYYWPPIIRKQELKRRLPDSVLEEWLVEKQHPSNALPDGADNDGQPVVPLVRPDYVTESTNAVVESYERGVCRFEECAAGNVTIVRNADGHGVGRSAVFDALTDPNAYHNRV